MKQGKIKVRVSDSAVLIEEEKMRHLFLGVDKITVSEGGKEFRVEEDDAELSGMCFEADHFEVVYEPYIEEAVSKTHVWLTDGLEFDFDWEDIDTFFVDDTTKQLSLREILKRR